MKYISRKKEGLFGNRGPQDFNINFGSEVWIQDVYTTGVDDLIQFMIINDQQKRIYVITWNLQLNREHSNFQSTYTKNTNPDYLFLKSFGGTKHSNFNIMLDHGAMINLGNNLPC